MKSSPRDRAQVSLLGWLAAAEVDHEPGVRPGEYLVQLPGEAKLRTTVSLLIGDLSLIHI